MSNITVTTTSRGENHLIKASSLPRNVEELKAFDLTNEYQAAAAVVCMLANFENDFDSSMEMLDYMMGPATPNGFDKDFIRDRANRYPYIARSYFAGSNPDNDYTPASYTVSVSENPYSRQNDGYVRLLLECSGADSKRPLTLRQKASTGEWFISSDSYKSVLTAVREPKSKDPWA